jgi:TetR/AcrR family transcriptional regulator, tetracycline repressor protein
MNLPPSYGGSEQIPSVSRPRPRLRRAGRPSRVGRDSIVSAAVEVGFQEISVSAVARHLGVKHSTLYRYFGSKDELVAAAVDSVVARAPWPEPTAGWRHYLKATARVLFRLLQSHPGLAAHIAALSGELGEFRRVRGRAAQTLHAMGFSAEDAVIAQDMANEQVLLFFRAVRSGGTAPGFPRSGGPDRPSDLIPQVADAFQHEDAGPPEECFARKLDVLLDGLAAMAPPERRA